MPYTNRRTLLPAVFISLLLHGTLLLSVVRPLPSLPEVPGVTLQLVVRDTRPPPPDSAPNRPGRTTSEAMKPTGLVVTAASRAAERAEPPKVPPKHPPKKELAAVSTPGALVRVARPSVTSARKPDPAPAEAAAPPVTSPAVPAAPLADSSVAPADTPSAAFGATVTAAPSAVSLSVAPGAGQAGATVARRSSTPDQGTVSAEALRPFRIALASAARRYKRYPALARERGWEGVAEVSIAIHKSLSPPTVELVTSSGHALLDDQAVEMMRRAAGATILPDPLRGVDFSVRMPVIFRLDEE